MTDNIAEETFAALQPQLPTVSHLFLERTYLQYLDTNAYESRAEFLQLLPRLEELKEKVPEDSPALPMIEDLAIVRDQIFSAPQSTPAAPGVDAFDKIAVQTAKMTGPFWEGSLLPRLREAKLNMMLRRAANDDIVHIKTAYPAELLDKGSREVFETVLRTTVLPLMKELGILELAYVPHRHIIQNDNVVAVSVDTDDAVAVCNWYREYLLGG